MRRGRLAVGLAAAAAAAAAFGGLSVAAGDGDGDAPDVVVAGPQGGVGQFVVACDCSHKRASTTRSSTPGWTGMSHRHEFFGNTTTDADSTYESLLAGDTTCDQKLDTGGVLGAVAARRRGPGGRRRGSVAYYRAGPGVDPTTVQPYPPGLMMVGGHSDATDSQPLSVVAWSCGPGGARSSEPPTCADAPGRPPPLGHVPRLLGRRPPRQRRPPRPRRLQPRRPVRDEHPVPIPQLQFAVDYPPTSAGPFSLASGPIETAHADFWNAWDEDKLATRSTLCLHRDLVCGISRTDNRTF